MKKRAPPKREHWVSSWLRLTPQVAWFCCGIGALRFVEVLVLQPVHGALPLLIVGVYAGLTYWLAGAALGGVALVTWGVRRWFGFAPVVKPSPTPRRETSRPETQEMRLRGWGFNVVAGWVVLSVLVLVVLTNTGTGPFAWFATEVLGLSFFAGPATFLLGLPAFAAPLVLLALLPWQTRWPLLVGIQAAVKPVPQVRGRRHP